LKFFHIFKSIFELFYKIEFFAEVVDWRFKILAEYCSVVSIFGVLRFVHIGVSTRYLIHIVAT